MFLFPHEFGLAAGLFGRFEFSRQIQKIGQIFRGEVDFLQKIPLLQSVHALLRPIRAWELG